MERPLIRPLPASPPTWVLGFGPAVMLLLLGVIGIFVAPGSPHRALLGIVLVISTLALLVRRRAPIPVLVVILATAAASDAGGVTTLAALLALLCVAMVSEGPPILLGGLATAGVIIGTPALHGHALTTPAPVISRMIAVALAVALGLYLRARAEYIVGLRDRAERLEREQELLATQAVIDERVRIARELHDVVAHNVSLMVVQAQALSATGSQDAHQHAGLERIAGIGREALSEMHRMLGVLRIAEPSEPEREPQPGVRDLATLVARTREAGLAANLTVHGSPRELPPGVDLSAYRIAQEALTNVLRHAEARSAEVTITYSPRTLELEVLDDGSGASTTSPPRTNGSSTGHGLVGMRERVAMFGGELEAGPRTETTGFRVRASLPVAR